MAVRGEPPQEVQIDVHHPRRGGNSVHPGDVATPRVPTPSAAPVVYTEIKHFKKWFPWLIPSFVVANVMMFVITMYVNNCPKKSISCVAGFLRRFSFQPFKENPLLGPSSPTLEKMGALDVSKVVHEHQGWRLVTCIWLHAGVFHLLANMLSLLVTGIWLEQEFGFEWVLGISHGTWLLLGGAQSQSSWNQNSHGLDSFLLLYFIVRIGFLYIISGLGGSILSALFIHSNISVGASGALFGLLGGMLSELITNWTLYATKVASFVALLVIIAINLAVGILPRVDNFAQIGGFLSGFLLGFVFLIRPQFGWVRQRYASHGYPPTSPKPKFKAYQCILWIISLILLIVGFTVGLVLLLRGEDLNDHCSWCHYLSCVPTSRWSCNTQAASCLSEQTGNQVTLTCSGSGKTKIYSLQNPTASEIQGLCTQLCR